MQIPSIETQSPRAANHDKNYWREIITTWQKSKEHPKDFCAQMNIKIATFTHWRGVFAKEHKQKENKFIPLQMAVPAQDKEEQFMIECPSGHKIIFASGVKSEQALQLFKLLGLIR